jgi:hypothetical protein
MSSVRTNAKISSEDLLSHYYIGDIYMSAALEAQSLSYCTSPLFYVASTVSNKFCASERLFQPVFLHCKPSPEAHRRVREHGKTISCGIANSGGLSPQSCRRVVDKTAVRSFIYVDPNSSVLGFARYPQPKSPETSPTFSRRSTRMKCTH